MANIKTFSQLQEDYIFSGYTKNWYNKIDVETCAENLCICGGEMRFIGVQTQDESSRIAIAHCDTCGNEYEF